MAQNAKLDMHFYRSFEGGLNTKDAPNVIGDNQLVEARNAVLGKGLITKRDGTLKSNTVAPSSNISNPAYPLALSVSGTGSALLTTTTYYVAFDYADATGRTTAGTSKSSIATTAAGQKIATIIVLPSGATSCGIYVDTAATPKRLATVTSAGVITYDGGKTSGLSVQVAQNTLYVTITDISGAGAPVPVASNTTASVTLGMTGMFNAYKSDGTTEFINVTNRALYRNVNGTLTQISGSPLSGNGVVVSYKDRNINDVVLLADGGRLLAYNYATCDVVSPHVPTSQEQTNPGLNDLTNLTNFRALALKKDRLFAAAHAEVRNRLSFCWRDPTLGYAVYDYWPATFFIDIAADENDEIVGMQVYRDRLIVFCKRSVWDLQGDGTAITDYSLTRVNVPKGCVSAKSIQKVEDEVFYLTEDGVYAISMNRYGMLVPRFVSDIITPSLEAYSLADRAASVGIYNSHKYLLSYPDGNTFVYDGIFSAWTMWANVNAKCFGVKDNVIWYGTSAGFAYYFSNTTHNDDGVAVDFFIRTRNNDFGNPVYLKQLIAIMLKAKQYDVETSQVDVTVIHNGASSVIPTISTDMSMVWDTDNWDFGTWDFNDVTTVRTYFSSQGREIQYTLRNNYVNQPCTIYQIDTQYMTLRV